MGKWDEFPFSPNKGSVYSELKLRWTMLLYEVYLYYMNDSIKHTLTYCRPTH